MSKFKDILKKAGQGIGGLFSGVIGEVPSMISDIVESQQNKRKLEMEIKLMLQKLEFEQKNLILELETELEKAYLEDVQSARQMQVEALRQNDLFSKRFIYYFAIAIFTVCSLVIFMLFYVDIPKENKTIIDMALGALVATGFVQVINFFFGSSKSSKDKTDLLENKKP